MLIIRDMEQKDEAVILEMMQDFYNSPACLHTVPEENFRRTLTEASAGNPCVRVLILEEKEGQDSETPALPLGYAHFTVSWNNEAGGTQIWFDELYLKAEARGKGCGTKVFKWLEENCPDVNRIRLEVTKENTRAISLYERLGYEELPYYQMCRDF